MENRGRQIDRLEFNDIFAVKFDKAYAELEALEDMVDQVDGILFQEHRYTIEELTRSKRRDRIHAIVEKIHSDVMEWKRNEGLPDWAISEYLSMRQEFEARVRRVDRAIRLREPTWWESVRQDFMSFAKMLLDLLLPDFLRRLLPEGHRPKGLLDE